MPRNRAIWRIFGERKGLSNASGLTMSYDEHASPNGSVALRLTDLSLPGIWLSSLMKGGNGMEERE